MTSIQNLLEKLQSDDYHQRYEACEKLRGSPPPLPQDAIDALLSVTNDSNPEVADAAQRALALHNPINNENKQEIEKVMGISSFGNSPKAKTIIVFLMFAVALIWSWAIVLTWQLDYIHIAALFFPMGLLVLINTYVGELNLPGAAIAGGWLLYLAIAMSITRTKNPRISRALFFVLAVLLVLNVKGCSMWTF